MNKIRCTAYTDSLAQSSPVGLDATNDTGQQELGADIDREPNKSSMLYFDCATTCSRVRPLLSAPEEDEEKEQEKGKVANSSDTANLNGQDAPLDASTGSMENNLLVTAIELGSVYSFRTQLVWLDKYNQPSECSSVPDLTTSSRLRTVGSCSCTDIDESCIKCPWCQTKKSHSFGAALSNGLETGNNQIDFGNKSTNACCTCCCGRALPCEPGVD